MEGRMEKRWEPNLSEWDIYDSLRVASLRSQWLGFNIMTSSQNPKKRNSMIIYSEWGILGSNNDIYIYIYNYSYSSHNHDILKLLYYIYTQFGPGRGFLRDYGLFAVQNARLRQGESSCGGLYARKGLRRWGSHWGEWDMAWSTVICGFNQNCTPIRVRVWLHCLSKSQY